VTFSTPTCHYTQNPRVQSLQVSLVSPPGDGFLWFWGRDTSGAMQPLCSGCPDFWHVRPSSHRVIKSAGRFNQKRQPSPVTLRLRELLCYLGPFLGGSFAEFRVAVHQLVRVIICRVGCLPHRNSLSNCCFCFFFHLVNECVLEVVRNVL
jgi:hypothetical protein